MNSALNTLVCNNKKKIKCLNGAIVLFFGYILLYWLLVVVQAIKHTAYTNLVQKDISEQNNS